MRPHVHLSSGRGQGSHKARYFGSSGWGRGLGEGAGGGAGSPWLYPSEDRGVLAGKRFSATWLRAPILAQVDLGSSPGLAPP